VNDQTTAETHALLQMRLLESAKQYSSYKECGSVTFFTNLFLTSQ